MAAQDRRAVRRLMADRDQKHTRPREGWNLASQVDINAAALEHGITQPNAALEALGFAPKDVLGAFEAAAAVGTNDSKRWVSATAALLAQTDPLPVPTARSVLRSGTANGGGGAAEQADPQACPEAVTVETMAALDADGCWVLVQCAARYPEARADVAAVAAVLLAAKSAPADMLPPSVRALVRAAVLAGRFDGARLILAACGVDPLVEAARGTSAGEKEFRLARTPGPEAPAAARPSLQDSLQESYLCPVTREVFLEPVTLGCGHNFERVVIARVVRENTTLAACPVCKHSIGATTLKVNIVLRETALKLFPHVILEARRTEVRQNITFPLYPDQSYLKRAFEFNIVPCGMCGHGSGAERGFRTSSSRSRRQGAARVARVCNPRHFELGRRRRLASRRYSSS